MPNHKLPLNLNTVSDINEFFVNWHLLSELDRLDTIKILKNSGNLGIIHGKIPSTENRCPLHSFPLAKPCSLTGCAFHLRGPSGAKESTDLIGISSKYKNCLVGYLNDSKNGKLTPSEISVLMGKPTSEINSLVSHAVAKLRKTIIREKVERFHVTRFSYLYGHCVNCEVSLHEELALNTLPQELTIEWEKFGWCTKLCKSDKPSWQFNIEREFRCEYIDAVAAATTVYPIDEVMSLLGIPDEEQPWLTKKTAARVEHLQRS